MSKSLAVSKNSSTFAANLIEYAKHEKNLSIYSPQFKGEEYSEFEKFLLTFMDNEEYGEDLGTIMGRLETIKRMGAEDRF